MCVADENHCHFVLFRRHASLQPLLVATFVCRGLNVCREETDKFGNDAQKCRLLYYKYLYTQPEHFLFYLSTIIFFIHFFPSFHIPTHVLNHIHYVISMTSFLFSCILLTLW